MARQWRPRLTEGGMSEDGVRWPRVLQPFAARPRLIAAALVGLAVFFLATPLMGWPITRALIAWDCGVIVFLALSCAFMMSADQGHMKRHAAAHDEGRHFILLLTIGAAVASVAAIAAELASARSKYVEREALRVALAAGTIALSWAFVQTGFALNYAPW